MWLFLFMFLLRLSFAALPNTTYCFLMCPPTIIHQINFIDKKCNMPSGLWAWFSAPLLSIFFNSLPTSILHFPPCSCPTVYSPHTLSPFLNPFLFLLVPLSFHYCCKSYPPFLLHRLPSLVFPSSFSAVQCVPVPFTRRGGEYVCMYICGFRSEMCSGWTSSMDSQVSLAWHTWCFKCNTLLIHKSTYENVTCPNRCSVLPLTLLPPLSLLFCSRSTSSISYTLISKVSVVADAPRRFNGAGGPRGPSTQHAPGLDEEEEEEVMACLEERWEGEDEDESRVSAGMRRRRWRPERRRRRSFYSSF